MLQMARSSRRRQCSAKGIESLESRTLLSDISSTYLWQPVRIGAGGLVTGFVTNPADPSVRFCRTDVGNAYRWDVAGSLWVPMIVRSADGTGVPVSAAVVGTAGVNSIATDPSNPDVVYVAFPVNHGSEATVDVYKSTDGGRIFTAGNLSVSGNPNGPWRCSGERLNVDPYNANIVYYGSDTEGLYRSTDGGSTWSQITVGGAPAATANVLTIQFARSGGTASAFGQVVTRTLYGIVADGDVYRSNDGGLTWSIISSGTPLSGHANSATIDQNNSLWVVQGASRNVWKYDGSWTTYLVGLGQNLQAVTIDPGNASRVFAIAVDGSVGRSLDGGQSWVNFGPEQFANALGWLPQPVAGWRSTGGIYFDSNSNLWIPQGNEGMLTYTPSPANSETPANPPRWTIVSQGIEEFCTQNVIIPKGSGDRVYLAVMDATGMVISNPDTFSARWITLQGNNLLSNSSGVAACPNDPNYIAITTSLYQTWDDTRRNASGYSTDGGLTWQTFASDPLALGTGSIAVSRHSAWTVGSDHLVWLPTDPYSLQSQRNWQASSYPPYYSKDGGRTWTASTNFPTNADGTLQDGMQGYWGYFLKQRQLWADPFVPDKYYLKMTIDAPLYISSDGGVTWTPAGDLPGWSSHGQLAVNYNVQNDLWFADGLDGPTDHGLWHSTNGGAASAKWPASNGHGHLPWALAAAWPATRPTQSTSMAR